jgi:hypothetical protein
MNHLAIFGTEYLELIAAPPGDTKRPEILGSPFGLNGLVFGTDDSASVHAALLEAGVPALAPREFSRPVELPDGTRDAVFRTVRLPDAVVPDGRLYFCHHLTRDLVWRDEWRHHANGVVGIARAMIMSSTPNRWAALFGSMFGADAVRSMPGGCALTVGLCTFEVRTPDVPAGLFFNALPPADDRADTMIALTFRTRSLDATAAALAAGQVASQRGRDGRITVPASAAFGTVLEFVA